MIIREAKPRPDYFDSKETVRYAWFPTRLKRGIDDKNGEIIWLEKYVNIYTHKRSSKKTWELDQSVRLSVHVINKLEKEANKKYDECEKDSSVGASQGYLQISQNDNQFLIGLMPNNARELKFQHLQKLRQSMK